MDNIWLYVENFGQQGNSFVGCYGPYESAEAEQLLTKHGFLKQDNGSFFENRNLYTAHIWPCKKLSFTADGYTPVE